MYHDLHIGRTNNKIHQCRQRSYMHHEIMNITAWVNVTELYLSRAGP